MFLIIKLEMRDFVLKFLKRIVETKICVSVFVKNICIWEKMVVFIVE